MRSKKDLLSVIDGGVKPDNLTSSEAIELRKFINGIVRQLIAAGQRISKGSGTSLEKLHNGRYQRTMTDEYDKYEFGKNRSRASCRGAVTRWRLFVAKTVPEYASMMERAKTADPKDYHIEDAGIH